MTLPAIYSDYQNIFSKQKTSDTLSVKRTKHLIELTNNIIIPYKPIYHLSKKELAVLRTYLLENEEKR